MTILPDYIIQTKSTSKLPIEVMQVVAALVHRLSSEKYESHSRSLHLICGILKTPSQKELWLPWSPIPHPAVKESVSTTSQSMQNLAIQWMLNRLSLAVTAFDEQARNMWAREWPEQCLNFLLDSTQFVPNFLRLILIFRFSECPTNDCRYSHRNRTEEDCSIMLKVSLGRALL